MTTASTDPVRASGGIVLRRTDDHGVEMALVHRPRYDDWTFPKGKCAPGEPGRNAALREVREETGLACEIDRPVGRVRYRDRKDRPKIVTYWLMTPVGGSFRPSDEVDRMRWVPIERAPDMLTYEHDRSLLTVVADLLS